MILNALPRQVLLVRVLSGISSESNLDGHV